MDSEGTERISQTGRPGFSSSSHKLREITMARTVPTDFSMPEPKVQKTEVAEQAAANTTAVGDDAGSGGSGGSGTAPLPLQRHAGNRKTFKHVLKYSGTTFIGQSIDAENGSENTWYRFPWEFTQHAIRSWESTRLIEHYLFWKAHRIAITVKNPICIQDQLNPDGQATAGQNLHAQLFGYEDNLYMTGIAQSYETGYDETGTLDGPQQGTTYDENELQNFLYSLGNHGYDSAGNIVVLAKRNVSRNSFQHNFPDVKQCGMGGGNSISYGWDMKSPYWRSTTELYNQMAASYGTFCPEFAVMWDENFGRVGLY